MEIIKHIDHATYDVTLSGKFTFADHPEFRDILQKIGDSAIKRVVFHMQKVEFVDSAALGMLLLALDEAEKHHKGLVISGATGQVKKMFDMAQFNTLFTMNDGA